MNFFKIVGLLVLGFVVGCYYNQNLYTEIKTGVANCYIDSVGNKFHFYGDINPFWDDKDKYISLGTIIFYKDSTIKPCSPKEFRTLIIDPTYRIEK